MPHLLTSYVTLAAVWILLLPSQAQAALIPDPGNAFTSGANTTRLTNPTLGYNNIEGIWNRFLATAFLVFGAIALIYMIWNSIRYISSNGDPKKIQEARQGIIYSSLAIVIIVTAYFIINFIIGAAELLFN